MVTDPNDTLAQVEQSDRQAAHDYCLSIGIPNAETLIGSNDDGALVQAFARHRLQSLSARPEAGVEEIDRLAQWLHDEGGFGDAYSGRTWPEHPDDTGQREGGYVKLVPLDAQAKFRDVAKRLLATGRLPYAALRDGGTGDTK